MPRKLNAALLSEGEVDTAFPLVRTAWPAVDLEVWRRFAVRTLGAGRASGILAVRNEQSCIVGLAAFRVCDELLHGRVLLAEPFCAIDIVDQASAARALASGLEEIAHRQACTAVHTIVTSSGAKYDGWLSAVLQDRGHRVEGLQLCKVMPTLR